MKFNDQNAIEALRRTATDRSKPAVLREQAINALVSRKDNGFGKVLLLLVEDADVRPASVRGLASYFEPETPAAILGVIDRLDDRERQAAIETLCSRATLGRILARGRGIRSSFRGIT